MMKLYLLTCELLQPGEYGSLHARLRTLGARQVLANQWAMRSTYTAAELKDIFKGLVDEGDRLVVTEVGPQRASRRALVNLAVHRVEVYTRIYRHSEIPAQGVPKPF